MKIGNKNNCLVGIVVASDFVRNVGKKTTTEEILNALGRWSTADQKVIR